VTSVKRGFIKRREGERKKKVTNFFIFEGEEDELLPHLHHRTKKEASDVQLSNR